jgi:hypothetical protein
MSLAPENKLKACLAVLYHATIQGRLLGWEGEGAGLPPERSAQLGDLMDAVHNIPDLVQRWEECDEDLLRSMLRAYDEKWSSSARLLEVYDRIAGSAA